MLTDITLRYLESFVAVVKYGGFTDAAKNVYRAQSSISSNILALEESLGVRLIDRTQKKSLVLTPDGKTFYRYASELLAQFRAIESHYSETVRPSLRAGAPGWAVGALLSGAAYVAAAFPGCDCSVITGSSEEITQQLLQGDTTSAPTPSAASSLKTPRARSRSPIKIPSSSRRSATSTTKTSNAPARAATM